MIRKTARLVTYTRDVVDNAVGPGAINHFQLRDLSKQETEHPF